jgi:ABC-2 type transport system ATP-binding protein
MAGEAIVELTSLTHHYGERVALHQVTLQVGRGSIFALLGPNGGGKTTLFKILTTLLTPTSGTARVAGADVATERDRVRTRIGIVFQKPSLDGKLTVLENLTHQGHLYGLSGKELRRRSHEAMERFRFADRANDRVETLSGGLQRRVELAKGLLHRPEVLILDEPSTGLDPGARADLMVHLRELRERDGVTSLLTTHLMDEADRCDRVGILDSGRLVVLGTPTDLKATIGGDVVTIHSGNPDSLAARAKERFSCKVDVLDGTVRIERQRGHQFVPQLIEAFPGEIDSVTVGKPTLDDVFLHLTGHRLWNGGGP